MREFLLYGVAIPLVLWFAVAGWRRAYALYRQDRRERLALALARDSEAFRIAWGTVKTIDGKIPSSNPWDREENRRGVV